MIAVMHEPVAIVQCTFTATRPNALWVADLTYIATWNGFVYVAFVIDVFACSACFNASSVRSVRSVVLTCQPIGASPARR